MSIFLRSHYGVSQLSARQILSDPILFLAFGFGSGLIKFMPGTWGTLAAVPLYWLIAPLQPAAYLGITLSLALLGVYVCAHAATKLKTPDFGGIVWDEIVGLLISLYGLPISWQSLLAGFVAFRLFDIVKPWPIRWLDKNIHGGLGIMLDDILAGIMAAAVLRFWW